MIVRLLSICRDKRGTATIELGIFAPVLAAMVIGVVDMSMAFGRKLAIEQATQRAIEKVMQTTGVKSVADTIVDEVAAQADISDAEKASKIKVTYSLECDAATPQKSSDPDVFDGYSCGSGTVHKARYIEVEVNDVYRPMFPLHFGAFNSAKGGYPVKATAGMRTQ